MNPFFPVLSLKTWLLTSLPFPSTTLHEDGHCLRHTCSSSSSGCQAQLSWADQQFYSCSSSCPGHFAKKGMHNLAHLGTCSWRSNRIFTQHHYSSQPTSPRPSAGRHLRASLCHVLPCYPHSIFSLPPKDFLMDSCLGKNMWLSKSHK